MKNILVLKVLVKLIWLSTRSLIKNHCKMIHNTTKRIHVSNFFSASSVEIPHGSLWHPYENGLFKYLLISQISPNIFLMRMVYSRCETSICFCEPRLFYLQIKMRDKLKQNREKNETTRLGQPRLRVP